MSTTTIRCEATLWEYASREAREATEEVLDLASLDGGLLPAPAWQYRINDLQHWIDLSA